MGRPLAYQIIDNNMTILCYGEVDLDIYLALDQLPTFSKSGSVTDEFDNVGGAAANSALWLANWGVPTRLAGHDLGDDAAGKAVMQVFNAHAQLDARFIAIHQDYRTPRCQCLVTPDGERSFIMHWLDKVRITAPSAAMLQDVKWVNLDMSGPLPPRLQMAEMACERGIPILINDIYKADHPLLPLVDVLVISASIVRSRFAAADPLELAHDLQSAGDCDVIVTDSRANLTVLRRKGERQTITPPAVQAIDTTGAGDIFKSGLLYGLLQDLPLPQAARWGAAAGSLMCQFAGATKTLAPLSTVEELMVSIT